MRNTYAGICYRCGLRVEAGEGHFERITAKARTPGDHSKWRTQHAECAIIWRGRPQPTMDEARDALRDYRKVAAQ